MKLNEILKAIVDITERGNSAEVKRRSDGSYVVYEVKKNIASCSK